VDLGSREAALPPCLLPSRRAAGHRLLPNRRAMGLHCLSAKLIAPGSYGGSGEPLSRATPPWSFLFLGAAVELLSRKAKSTTATGIVNEQIPAYGEC
jgi:hypothetical protein